MKRNAIQFTAEQYRALPADAPRMELLDGEFVMAPARSPRHQMVVGRLYRLLCDHVEARGTGIALVSPCDVYLSESDVPQPDLLVLLNEHRDRIRDDGVHGPPDLAVEVLSPSTGAQDLTLKREIYRLAGVPEYWILDPRAQTVSLWRLQESPERTLFKLDDRLASPLLPGFEPTVRAMFEP